MLRSRLYELSSLLGSPVSEERDPAEMQFLSSVQQLVSNVRGQVFPTSVPGAQLTIVNVKKMLEDPDSDAFEFLAPLVVHYEGSAAPAEWAAAEQALEARFLEAIRSTAASVMGDDATVKLLRRRKSDPFKDDPRSLTILRFRVT